MTTPKPKHVDMRKLKKKLGQEQEQTYDHIKGIYFPLPDLRGPQGNAFWLLGEAKRLMEAEGIVSFVMDEFHSEATSGDYDHLLATIRKWFTVVVPTTTYEPLPDDQPIPGREEADTGLTDGSE